MDETVGRMAGRLGILVIYGSTGTMICWEEKAYSGSCLDMVGIKMRFKTLNAYGNRKVSKLWKLRECLFTSPLAAFVVEVRCFIPFLFCV